MWVISVLGSRLFNCSLAYLSKRELIIFFKLESCITFSYKTQNNNVITFMHHRNLNMSINIIAVKTPC
jgi:hypothetical protein